MAMVWSNGSTIVVRSKDSVAVGVDSRTTNDWGIVLSHKYMKCILLRDPNHVILAFSGPCALFEHLHNKFAEKFPHECPPQMSVYDIAKTVREIGQAYLYSLPVEDETPWVEKHACEIFVVGADYDEKRVKMFTIATSAGGFEDVEEASDEVLFGGTGASSLKRFWDTLNRDLTEQDAIDIAKDALEYATKHDLSSGGILRVYTINTSQIYTCTWSPVDENKCVAGYGPLTLIQGFD